MNRKGYNVYIKYNSNVNSVSAIEGWYCECKYRKRTVGCCSHITSIIYYLSYFKSTNKQLSKKKIVEMLKKKISEENSITVQLNKSKMKVKMK